MLLLALLSACARDEVRDTEVPGDTAPFDPSDRPPLETMFHAAHEPPAWMRAAKDWVAARPACPAVTDVDAENFTIAGNGCTATDGRTYTGTIAFLDSVNGERVLFEGWTVTEGDVSRVYDGEIVLPTAGQLQSTYAVRDPDGAVAWSYADHLVSSFGSYEDTWVAREAGASFTAEGLVTVAGIGTFTVAEQVGHDGACDREPDHGVLAMTGPTDVTFTLNGVEICDGCVFVETATGDEDICPFTEAR